MAHMNATQDQLVLDAFNNRHGSKYQTRGVLGSGNNGICYEALEIASQVPVAVKLSSYGLDVAGQRDFRVPRLLGPTRRVAALHTIQPFNVGKLTHYGVVSQLIRGVTLERFIEGLALVPFDRGTESDRDFALMALRDLAGTLCDGVEAMHQAGFGHGDLHERNVLVSAGNPRGWPNIEATLIDLGNASVRPTRSVEENENALKVKDLSALRKCLNLLFQHLPTAALYRKGILGTGPDVSDIRWVVERLTYAFGAGSLNAELLTEDFFDSFFRELLARQIAGSRGAAAFRDVLREAADSADVRPIHERAVKHHQEQIETGEIPKVEFSSGRTIRQTLDVGAVLRRLVAPEDVPKAPLAQGEWQEKTLGA